MARGLWALVGVLVVGGVAALLMREPSSPVDVDEPPPVVDLPEPAKEPELIATDPEPAAPKLEGAPQTEGAPAEKPKPSPGTVWVFGRVTHADATPAPGASVTLVIEDEEIETIESDADGAFRFVIAPTVATGTYYASLRIRHPDGSAFHQFAFRNNPARTPQVQKLGAEVNVGERVLQSAHGLDVHVDLAGADGATVWVTPHAMWLGSAWWASAQTDGQGRVHFDGVPAGSWRIIAADPEAGRGQAFVKLPQKEEQPVEITLAARKPLRVTVKDKHSGDPIVGAILSLGESVRAPSGNYSSAYFPRLELPVTDEAGSAVLTGLANKHLSLSVNAEGYPLVSDWQGVKAAAIQTIKVAQEEVTFELARPRTIRWAIVAGEVPVPAAGSTVTLKAAPGARMLGGAAMPEQGTIEDGDLVVAGWGPSHVHGIAVAPDGSLARLFAKAGEERGSEITFIPARTIEATITYPDGTPVAGFHVSCTNQGNNLVASAETDEAGHARIEGLYGGPRSLVEVKVNATKPSHGGGLRIATVDLAKGDGKVEGTVYREIPLVVRMSFEGKPGIPEGLELDPGGFGPARGLRLRIGPGFKSDPEMDRATGEIKLTWRPAGPATEVSANAVAPGYLNASQTLPVSGTDVLTFDLDLKRAAVLAIDVKLPSDGRVRVNLERYDTEKQTWSSQFTGQMAMGGYAKPDANGAIRLEPLEAGRYRVVDRMNGLVGKSIDVAEGATASVPFDLSKAGQVTGHIEVPDGEKAVGILVLLDGGVEFGNRPWMGRPHNTHRGVWAFTNPEGKFWIRVPGNQPVTLRPSSPTLVPAKEGGSVTITAPQEGVVLKLERGPLATVRFPAPLEARPQKTPFGQPGTRRVWLYEKTVEGEPAARLEGRLNAATDALSFAGFKPGTYTVWIDAEPFAPLVIPNVTLTAGTTDLGEVAPQNGATLLLEVQLKPGEDMPRASVYAAHLGAPAYSRRGRSQKGSTTLSLSGLGPGRFTVSAHQTMSMGRDRFEFTIESDGQTDVKLVWDLSK